MVALGHLRPEMHDLAALPGVERLARLPANRWIGYTRANQVLALLERMLDSEPGKIRPRNLLIVGPSNNGKTTIAERFLRDHPPYSSGNDDREIVPVLALQMPASPTLIRFHAAILAALNSPVSTQGRTLQPESISLRLLTGVGCRMLIIDELHNLLAATSQRQREMLNLLRFLGNALRIPLVCLGTREAYLALRTDDQLENRFQPFVLPLWEDGPEFARLLASFEAVLPLREPSGLGTPELRKLVAHRTEGIIGEVAALLTAATSATLLAGAERIDAGAIEAADYQPPSVRRRLFERELR